MERIRQAVEKARRDREDKAVPRGIETVTGDVVPKQVQSGREAEGDFLGVSADPQYSGFARHLRTQ